MKIRLPGPGVPAIPGAVTPPKFLWIQTRDGSPTLWSNELGESFRSVKGAFTESWVAFVGPALARARNSGATVTVGEFGLGAGTNWILWSLAARRAGVAFEYFAIERETEAFRMGRARWAESPASLRETLRGLGGFTLDESARGPSSRVEGARDAELNDDNTTLDADSAENAALRSEIVALPDPHIFASLEAAVQAGARADLWFHDPFGYDVNPDGYTPATLAQCQKLWSPENFWGGSYACNRHFREALEALGPYEVRVVPTGSPLLKRERLEFMRHSAR
jgi:hypothetical protein